jgi:hypothetical protein
MRMSPKVPQQSGADFPTLPSSIVPGLVAREINDLPEALVGRIMRRVAQVQTDFEPSPLYSVADAAERVDEGVRVSESQSLMDSVLFDLAEEVVAHISKTDDVYAYGLKRDDLQLIRYRVGGFFDAHQDFCSVRSNLLTEFTLLLCVTPHGVTTVGGRTTVYLSASIGGGLNSAENKPAATCDSPTAAVSLLVGKANEQTFGATTRTGCALLLRKDAWHAGAVLEVPASLATHISATHI